ncbi:MAG TPA: hypothetical protein VMT11_14050 [Myxococcaceae bacterium]|nr:hypothetical protein [Myxococcaceae bacterium]
MSRAVVALCILAALPAFADDQRSPGAGNGLAIDTARASARLRSASAFLIEQARQIRNGELRRETLDILSHPDVCARHRKGLTEADKDQIVAELLAAGLVNPTDAAAIDGGVKAGVFPPAIGEGTSCVRPPLPFIAAPGSSYSSHHAYPGGLTLHTEYNTRSSKALARDYPQTYGGEGHDHDGDEDDGWRGALLGIDPDIVIAAPIWHDWAKTLVFQWNADGSEFIELNFGGAGVTDNAGKPGDSRTGGHHIIGVAESMSRGLAPAMVIAQASAHSNPTLGNEFKVVNWLRAAAMIARIDPVATGYLSKDGTGALRLPPLRQLGSLDLNAAGQTNVLAEYTINNLSDGDFTFSIPVIPSSLAILKTLAPEFGYDPTGDATKYNTKFRNVVLSQLSGEFLYLTYSRGGLDAIRAELKTLRRHGLI